MWNEGYNENNVFSFPYLSTWIENTIDNEFFHLVSISNMY